MGDAKIKEILNEVKKISKKTDVIGNRLKRVESKVNSIDKRLIKVEINVSKVLKFVAIDNADFPELPKGNNSTTPRNISMAAKSE